MTLTLRALTVRYGRVEALSEVTATARSGRITAIIGPNAAGKTTLLRAAIGSIRPRHGSVRLGDRPAHRLLGAELARRVAFVSQRPVVSAAFSVRKIVELGRYALPPDATRVEAALEALQLNDVATRRYPELSVGQQQRVALARAMAQLEPGSMLLLDEPTGAMDLRFTRLVYRLLRQVADDGAGVVISMHALADAAELADEVWVLDSGRLVAAGSPGDVMTRETLGSVFGVTFTEVQHEGRRLLFADPLADGIE